MISKKQQLLRNQLNSFISFIHFRHEQRDAEITPQILEATKLLTHHLSENENPTHHFTLWAWEKLTALLPDSFEEKYLTLHKALYFKETKPSTPNHYAPTPPLEKQSAKQLLKQVNYSPGERYNSEEENDALEAKQAKIKQILKTKEHVLKPNQSKLIRKMSIHSGKKLSLQEAQKLQNRLKAK